MSSMKQTALLYVREFGFNVIPLNAYKRPMLARDKDEEGNPIPGTGWKRYVDERVTTAQVREWWTRWPDANIGILTGKVSNLLVLDADNAEANDRLAAALGNGHLPHSKTPRGYHWYFTYPAGAEVTIGSEFLPNCDWRGHGGYVVAPPSVTAAVQETDKATGAVTKIGGPYKQLKGRSFKDRPAVPNEVLYLLYSEKKYRASADSPNPAENPQATLSDTNPIKRHEATYFKQGSRDEDIFHVACDLVKAHNPEPLVRQVLQMIAKSCEPPFPPEEVEVKIQSAIARGGLYEKNVAADVREWVQATPGVFSATLYHSERHSTTSERRAATKAFERLCSEGLIERVGSKRGYYRTRIEPGEPVDWKEADSDFVNLDLPWGLNEMVEVAAGSQILCMGSQNSGKTSLMTWLARHNMKGWKVRYLSTETSAGMFRALADKYMDISIRDWDVEFYEDLTTNELQDYVAGGEGTLTLVDYIEVYDNFYQVGQILRDLHSKLNGGVMVAAVQKRQGATEGIGGHFNLMKPHIGLAMDYDNALGRGKVTLAKAKIPCQDYVEMMHSHPMGKECTYRWDGSRYVILSKPAWSYPVKE